MESFNLSIEQKKQESNMSLSDSQRAIYIDFEGFVDHPPALVGVEVEGVFTQFAFHPGLAKAASYKKIELVDPKEYLLSLLARALNERRRIVAFSQHEKNIFKEFFSIDLEPVYADARLLAKKNRKLFQGNTADVKSLKSLEDYLRALNIGHKNHFGFQKATKKLRYVIDMSTKNENFDDVTPSTKKHWTNLLEYNKIDVVGMRILCHHVLNLNESK